jgi:hypothetical protein
MSAQKCCYTTFVKGGECNKFVLKLFDETIPYEKKPRFLGVSFDERLTFENQVENVRNKCLKRLNILKIISHRSWRLNQKVLINTYLVLIRSVIDYNFVIANLLSNSNMLKLQRIQNSAIRTIFHVEPLTNLVDFASQKNLIDVRSRLSCLYHGYIFKCLLYQNPLICNLCSEYRRGFEARPVRCDTALCSMREVLF